MILAYRHPYTWGSRASPWPRPARRRVRWAAWAGSRSKLGGSGRSLQPGISQSSGQCRGSSGCTWRKEREGKMSSMANQAAAGTIYHSRIPPILPMSRTSVPQLFLYPSSHFLFPFTFLSSLSLPPFHIYSQKWHRMIFMGRRGDWSNIKKSF